MIAVEAHLLPHAHAVVIGEDLVFLDVRHDRYFCWAQATGLDLSEDGRRLRGDEAGDIDALVASGLASAEPQDGPTTPTILLPKPSGDLCAPLRGTLPRRELGEAARGCLDSVTAYRSRSFGDLVAFAANRPSGADPDTLPGTEMMRITHAFHAWAPWMPAPAKCLIRSFVLLRLLRRRGLDARWVFAVKTWPFEAHCWLQAGAIVLDDAHERLAAYRPILVV